MTQRGGQGIREKPQRARGGKSRAAKEEERMQDSQILVPVWLRRRLPDNVLSDLFTVKIYI